MDWKEKVVLLTGAAAGIGRATAEELCRQGAKVAICDLDVEKCESVCRQLVSKYGKDRAIYCECDVTDYPQFEEAFQTVIETFGKLDAVVNNAGVMNDRLWELEVDVNLNGVIRGTLLALQILGKDKGGRGGVIINIGSNSSVKPYSSLPIFSATKHAVLGLTRAFGDSFHFAATGVRVICVCPGPTELGQDVRKQLLSSSFEPAWQKDTHTFKPQKSEHVAMCIAHIGAVAASGTTWLIENGNPGKQIAM